ncbi:hypothetical protein CRG98_046396 [Punica granatum]|uniref:Uncharacterized protein n=1 Tax=Punica granatum TaxID=22663 RepID=A0A2I0HNS2_PUNGR|nr:hypothetical protein CRG98_046396 [Punica granatum]
MGHDRAQRAWMIDFLTEYQEIFAWSYADMPGLDPSIVKHFLPLDTEKFLPKRQHLRRQRADLLLHIKEEVIKQVDAGFLELCNYFEWVANIVPVEKKNGKVRVCIDYRDPNRASPKDNFSLPHIDVLVDNTGRYTQFSIMDGVRTQMWTPVEARIARFWIAQLGSVHLPLGTRDGHATQSCGNLKMGLGTVRDLPMGLGPTKDLRVGLGFVGNLTKGLGPTEDQTKGLSPGGI